MLGKHLLNQALYCRATYLSRCNVHKTARPLRNLFYKHGKESRFSYQILTHHIRFKGTSSGSKKNIPLFVGLAAIGGAAASYFLLHKRESSDNQQKALGEDESLYVHEGLQEDLALLKEFGQIPYLLIGAGTASHSAYRAIRTSDPTARILIVGDEVYRPYLRPPLSKELWYDEKADSSETLSFAQFDGKRRSIFYEVPEFYFTIKEMLEHVNGGVSVIRGKKVVKIDPVAQIAYLDKGEEIHYSKCLIATGSKPKNLPTFEKAPDSIKKHVTLFRNINDFKKLYKISDNIRSVIIVGGGYLGSELACGLAKRGSNYGLKVTQIFPESSNLGKVLPEYLGKYTTNKVEEEGVTVIPNVSVKSVYKTGDKIELLLSDDKVIKGDHVVVAVGGEPNTELAKPSGLEVDEINGGFLVNAEMEARKNLWIAGDASCFYDILLGRRRVEHHDHAMVSGRLAGENMAGQSKPYKHQSMFWSDLGVDIGFEAVGVIDSALPTVAVFAKSKDENEDAENLKSSKVEDDYKKGVVFYLKSDIVVGIVLWNCFGYLSVARKIINESKAFDDLAEVAKLFKLHPTDGEE